MGRRSPALWLRGIAGRSGSGSLGMTDRTKGILKKLFSSQLRRQGKPISAYRLHSHLKVGAFFLFLLVANLDGLASSFAAGARYEMVAAEGDFAAQAGLEVMLRGGN